MGHAPASSPCPISVHSRVSHRDAAPGPDPSPQDGRWIATSPVPAAQTWHLKLVPDQGSLGPTTPKARNAIRGGLHIEAPLPSLGVPIALRLFRSDPLDGLLLTWSDHLRVDADQTGFPFEIADQEPGAYRLVAYRAMTEPLAVLEIHVEGEPSPLRTAPPVPAGWRAVSSTSGDLVLSLPLDFDATPDRSSILANSAPHGKDASINVRAESPAGADPQPAPGKPLTAWLDERWPWAGTYDRMPPVTMAVRSPAGEAVLVVRSVDLDGRWRTSMMYAVRTAAGVGSTVLEGPADLMSAREAELGLIAQLVAYPEPGPEPR